MPPRPARRVLHVTQPTVGGSARVVRSLVRIGVARGDHVVVACPDDGELSGWVEEEGATWARVPMARSARPSEVLRLPLLARLMRDSDLVLAHSSKAGALVRLAGRPGRRGIPAIIFLPHGWSWFVGGALAPVYRRFERWAQRRTSAIVCVGEREAEAGRAVLGNGAPIEVIENAVDVDRFTPAGPVAARDGAPLLVLVGRLTHVKGQDRAIHVLARLPDPEVRLRLVGDGEDRAALLALARALGVQDRVEVTGWTDPLPHLRAADLVIVPSRWEGLPLAMLEAMSAGAVVVATEAAGGAALGEAGVVLAETEDEPVIAGLVDICASLLSRPGRRGELSQAAADRARARYSMARFAGEHGALWDRLARTQ